MKVAFAPAYLVAMSMLLLGMVGGVVFDAAPPRPRVYRAGYRVLESDFHTHTSWSDGSLSPLGIVRQASRRGLDVVSVTEHNTVLPSYVARAYARITGGPLVVTGEEITTATFHVIALGIEKTVSPDQTLDAVLEEIHAQRGVAIAAHPVRHYWPALRPRREHFDAAEVMHPIAYAHRGPEWSWADMVTFYQDGKEPLAPIGSSDYHWMSVLGLCRTLVFVREPVTESAVVDAVREKRTVTFDLEGKAYGEAKLLAALRAEPYVPRTSDYSYRGAGSGDRVLRTLGWLGLLGLVLLRARKASARGARSSAQAHPRR